MGTQAVFERRVFGALEASPSRIPVVLGGCGTGRTSLLKRLLEKIDGGAAQYVDVERCATTPERFLRAVTAASPVPVPSSVSAPTTPREAFDGWLSFVNLAQTPAGQPATFLLDEVLELRTFESFPGLRHVMDELIEALSASPNRFVLTSRYVARAHRLLRDATARFEVVHIPALSAADVTDMLAPAFDGYEQMATEDRDDLGRATQALTDGRAVYVGAIRSALAQMGRGADPVSALTLLFAADGALNRYCHAYYELRLHRARGYGALKAILDILAEQEPLTLTEISQRLHRTPGSTKDYLSWLEDVDLVTVQHKRYAFSDPLLRVWVRLCCRPTSPCDEEVAREVQRYALTRLPHAEAPPPVLAYASVEPTSEERKNWGIIEID